MPNFTNLSRPTRIAVVGSGGPDGDRAQVEAIGRGIAEAGAVLVCGGRGGAMAAAARGARSAGGATLGLLPGASRDESPPNRWIEIPIYTGLGQGRNLLVVLNADAVIAVGGGWGTLSEVALARKHGRPVVLLGDALPGEWAGSSAKLPQPLDRQSLTTASTPENAVRKALALAAAGDVSTP